jgi:hypothetical protein
MNSTLNLTKDIRLPSLELFLKYSIKNSLRDKEILGEKGDRENPLSYAMSEKGGLV